MIHSDGVPGSACPGRLIVLRQLDYRSGRVRGVWDLWECERCRAVNSPIVARRLKAVWRHLSSGGRLDRRPTSDSGARRMKLRLSVSRKGGAPNYGSDGAAAELELDLDDEATPQQLLTQCTTWYKTLEHAVDTQLAGMQAKHPGPQHSPANQVRAESPASAAIAAPMPPGSSAPPAAIVPFEPRRPEPRRAAPEPGWDEMQPAAPAGPPPGRGPRGGGVRDDPPRNGSQLLGWAYNHGQDKRLKALAKDVDRGPIKDWRDDLVAWAYGELTRPQPAGQWGGN